MTQAETKKESIRAATPAWTNRPERSNMLMLRVMTFISLRFGRPVGRVILHGIALYFLLFSPKSRNASTTYLSLALGRQTTWLDMYRHFFSFASTIHDRIYLINQRFDLFNIQIIGQHYIDNLVAQKHGLFLIGAHMGSFEVIQAIGRQVPDLQVSIVMHEDNALKINAMLESINPKATADIIGMGRIDSLLKVSERLAKGSIVGVLADRALGEDILHPASLLGKTVYFPTGSFRMAALMRQRVIFMVGLYLGGNRYQINFEPLADFSQLASGHRTAAVAEAVTRYAELLEKYGRLAPYNWFNFFDFWQTPPTHLHK
jgi:predicted LPLAT superfamily acyltransferase